MSTPNPDALHQVLEQALYTMGEPYGHYDPTSAEQNVADAQHVLDAVKAAGFAVSSVRDQLGGNGVGSTYDPAPSLQRRLFDECETVHWDPDKRNTLAEEIAHLHEEVSEAFREWRLHKDCEIRYVDGKPTGVPIEFADVLIGLFYNAELHGFDLLEAVEIKHRYNLTRDYVAEGRQLHPPVLHPVDPPRPEHYRPFA